MTLRTDCLVIGSGPGGAVTARALAERGLDVLVVEEGEWIEPGTHESFSLEQMRHQYRNAGLTVALGRPSIAYTEGRGAGGGSEVNSGLYHRPPAVVLAEWSRVQRIDELTPDSLAPWHDVVERELQVAAWPEPALPPASDVLRRGADHLGWAGLDVPRWARYSRGPGGVEVHKQTMTRTYLPAAQDAGVRVLTGTRASRVRLHHGRAVGADVVRRSGGVDHVERIDADVVFVCGGATQTPALLQRSGLRRNIGPNFSVHPTVKVVAEFDDEIDAAGDLPTYQVKEFGPWLSLGGSASRPALIALALAENWPDFGPAMQRWRRQGVYYAAVQSIGRGRVRSVPGVRDPLVTYHLDRRDAARLATGLGRLMHLLLAAGARRLYPSFVGAPVVEDAVGAAAAVNAFRARRASLMSVHLTGTVPMGEDVRRAGADSFGRVHGAAGLHVNDASLLPWAPGVNPQGTVMAVAHRNAARFLDDHAPTSTPRGGLTA